MKARIKDLPPGVGVGKAVSGRGKEYWRVRLGKKFTGGPVVLKDFSKLEEAREWIFGGADKEKATPGAMIDLKEKAGMVAFELSATDLHESAGALKELEKAGMTLTEAIQFAIRHAKPPAGVLSVAKAIEGALAEKSKSKRPAYLADLGKRWRRFERWLPTDKLKAINGITKLDIRRFLNDCKLNPMGERNMLRNLSVLFSWAVNQHHMAENPCLGMTVEESTTKRSVVRILSIEEARELLHLVAAGFKVEADEREKNSWREKFGAISLTVPPMDLVPIIAVGCFGGVRPEESARMTWDMVDFKRKHIDLPADITKDGDRRIVDMSENLAEWLLPCRKESGPLLPYELPPETLGALPGDELEGLARRHSAALLRLLSPRQPSKCRPYRGTDGPKNARMLYAHYREVVKDASDIEEYWRLTPGRSSNLIRLHDAA